MLLISKLFQHIEMDMTRYLPKIQRINMSFYINIVYYAAPYLEV